MTPIKVGVVGLSKEGWASIALIGPLLRAPLSDNYTLTALSTRSPESASESARKYSELAKREVKPYHGDTSRIASDKDVDLVVVAVRAPSHMQAALPIIEAGKNIFIEWPCGGNFNNTKLLSDAAQSKGVRSMVGMQGTQSPEVRKAKEWVSSGMIGRVLSSSVLLSVPKELKYWGPIVAENNSYTVDESSGASMLNIAVGHFITCFTSVLGDFSSVTATTQSQYSVSTEVDRSGNPTGRILKNTAADQITFNGVLKSGAVVSVHCRGGHPSTQGRSPFIWVIDGEEGSIKMESDSPGGSFIQVRSPSLYLNGDLVAADEGEDKLGNIGRAWLQFSRGAQGDYPSLEDAVRIHRVVDAISRSAKEGRRVDLD